MKDEQIERLREFKKDSGWSYQKIANLLGVHYQTLIFWLNETYKPSKHLRPKIEEFLNMYSYKQAKR